MQDFSSQKWQRRDTTNVDADRKLSVHLNSQIRSNKHNYKPVLDISKQEFEKKFAYPVHFISEEYHIVDDNTVDKASLRLLPNRLPEHTSTFDNTRTNRSLSPAMANQRRSKESAPFGRNESRHLLPKPQRVDRSNSRGGSAESAPFTAYQDASKTIVNDSINITGHKTISNFSKAQINSSSVLQKWAGDSKSSTAHVPNHSISLYGTLHGSSNSMVAYEESETQASVLQKRKKEQAYEPIITKVVSNTAKLSQRGVLDFGRQTSRQSDLFVQENLSDRFLLSYSSDSRANSS